ncbi:MAG: ribonuclease III [Firmicutes bacterium]|nr:ribonuclease III [Bacillota bacterium]
MLLKKERIQRLKELQENVKYNFNNLELLNRALTHSSYANENKKKNLKYNERLEFLGDSVLGLVISDYLFNNYPKYPEGELTKIRSLIVCEPSLASIAKEIKLGRYLLLGKGEEATGGRERISILADAFEAVIGAIYLDGKLKHSRKFILNSLNKIIEDSVKGKLFLDYKTQLQEYIQKNSDSNIEYSVTKEIGPDHNKIFYIEVKNGDKVLGIGKGKSKKEAEQNAARSALIKVGDINE